jgi:hypothetical protein
MSDTRKLAAFLVAAGRRSCARLNCKKKPPRSAGEGWNRAQAAREQLDREGRIGVGRPRASCGLIRARGSSATIGWQ